MWYAPTPRLVADLDRYEDWPADVEPGGSVLVYNPCDGWHILWTIEWSPDKVVGAAAFEYWMPGPGEPPGFDRDAWMARVERQER